MEYLRVPASRCVELLTWCIRRCIYTSDDMLESACIWNTGVVVHAQWNLSLYSTDLPCRPVTPTLKRYTSTAGAVYYGQTTLRVMHTMRMHGYTHNKHSYCLRSYKTRILPILHYLGAFPFTPSELGNQPAVADLGYKKRWDRNFATQDTSALNADCVLLMIVTTVVGGGRWRFEFFC